MTLLRTALPESFDFIHAHHQILRTIRKDEGISNNLKKPLNGELDSLKSKLAEHRKKIEVKALSFDKIVALLFGNGVYEKLGIPNHLNTRSWPDNKSQRVKHGPFPTDYWGRAYMEDLESNELEDNKIILAHQQWCLDPDKNKDLLKIFRCELTDLKWVELHLELDDDQTLQLVRAILLDQNLGSPRQPCSSFL